MLIIFEQMATLFSIILLGFLLGKVKIIDTIGINALSKFVLNVALPCTILCGAFDCAKEFERSQVLSALLSCCLGAGICCILGLGVTKLLNSDQQDRGVYQFLISFGNYGFMGYPVALALCGREGAFMATMIQIPTNLLMYSIGVRMLSKKNKIANIRRMIFNVPMIFAVISLVICLMQIGSHPFFYHLVSLIGNITTPGAMLIIGASIAAMSFETLFGGWRIYVATFARLIVAPAIAYICFREKLSGNMLYAFILLLGTPTATVATMLSIEGGGNSQLAAQGTCITAVVSLATLPIIAFLFSHLPS